MNKEYKIKIDLNKKLYNKKMAFNQFDENVNDFYIEVTKNNEVVKDLDKSIITLVAIKPNGEVDAQFIEVKEGQIYADLKPSMCDLVGNYQAKAMIVLEGEIVTTDTINYSVNEDKIISRLNDDVVSDERFPLFTDALARLSDIEISEEQRVINEAERILSEENRKIEEAKRVEAELIRQHEEADRAKYDATRESNENIRKQNESIRLANETNRIDEEAKRVEEETKRVEAEQLRNANYNFMTEDEERRRLEANAHKEAEVLRVQAETNRVNEEAKRRTTEQARVSAENTRVSNENTRKANETTRQTNETQRVEAETQRQNRYNSFIADAEANANNFENYTNTAKVKEEERKSNELDRKSQEDRRVSNEVERISNENTRKANEVAREKNETSRQNIFENKVNEVDEKIAELNTTKDNFVSNINTKVDTKISEIDNVKDNFVSSISTKVDSKISELDNAKSDITNTVSNKVNEVENRFNALTSKQQQDAEVIDARDGETSLKARLDRDIEKAKQVYVDVEGSHISTDSSVGYAKNIEILGNTIQSASNLADIRSVGDKVEGQELYEIPVLSCGKNLFDKNKIVYNKWISSTTGAGLGIDTGGADTRNYLDYTKIKGGSVIKTSNITITAFYVYDKIGSCINIIYGNNSYIIPSNAEYMRITFDNTKDFSNAQIEYETSTPYEPYQEDKLTILSPVQLEKVGDIADRIIEKNGVWGVEKNVVTTVLDGSESISSTSSSNDSYIAQITLQNANAMSNRDILVLSDKLLGVSADDQYSNNTKNTVAITSAKNLKILVENVSNFSEMKEWLKNLLLIKYPTTQPRFIPLPHDQQIKLRTFANKTNISFLTEIEGTIKAQVPKSIGATVNTHTEQINNLNKELDRVKKLEESTVSTVTTESDFTTVEATSNGYFEDVKLEGKTLVNLATQPTNNGSINHQYATISTVTNIKPSTEYTYIIRNNGSETLKLYLNHNGGFDWFDLDVEANSTVIGKAKTLPTIDGDIWLSLKKAETVEQNLQVVLLEGDHTQNPPSYFEGLKSVGQSATTSEDGVDEVSVESVSENLFDATLDTQTKNGVTFSYDGATGEIVLNGTCTENNTCVMFKYPTKFIEGNTYYLRIFGTTINSPLAHIRVYDDKYVGNNLATTSRGTSIHKSSSTRKMVKTSIRVDSGITFNNFRFKVQLIVNEDRAEYIPHQSDKKRLLYYNNETQSWEKPILREWDSIEKHADGKYYYHQRSGEVVLDGSEDEGWWDTSEYGSEGENTLEFRGNANNILRNLEKSNLVCDKFNFVAGLWTKDAEGICCMENNTIDIRMSKSKLSTQDTAGFKQWLQANNVTVVYQLAQEKVYECTNIDLITYANETNYVVESGVLSPRTTLKVHSNISNVVSLLQKKVSLLESNVKASQEVQDMMILETDMRMLDIELALMEFIPMTLNLGGSNMLRSATYFNFLKNHIINETYEKEYLENVMNKYLATGRINQDEYNELYKMLYPPVYDIELPIEY